MADECPDSVWGNTIGDTGHGIGESTRSRSRSRSAEFGNAELIALQGPGHVQPSRDRLLLRLGRVTPCCRLPSYLGQSSNSADKRARAGNPCLSLGCLIGQKRVSRTARAVCGVRGDCCIGKV